MQFKWGLSWWALVQEYIFHFSYDASGSVSMQLPATKEQLKQPFQVSSTVPAAAPYHLQLL